MKKLLVLLATLACASASAAPVFEQKAEHLSCGARVASLEAECFPAMGKILACTKQSLSFSVPAGGKRLNTRVFKPDTAHPAFDYPSVEEKFGELSCVETAARQEYVVAEMYNGGNCESCEWFDVYTPDGVLVGSTRNRKARNKVVDAAVAALFDEKTKRVLAQNTLEGFYEVTVLPCNGKPVPMTERNINDTTCVLTQRLATAFGKRWNTEAESNAQIRLAPEAMAGIAEAAACAAVFDKDSSCAMFFDPEFSTTLGVFTMHPKKTPLRRQFDDALNALPNSLEKKSALACMKLVATK